MAPGKHGQVSHDEANAVPPCHFHYLRRYAREDGNTRVSMIEVYHGGVVHVHIDTLSVGSVHARMQSVSLRDTFT